MNADSAAISAAELDDGAVMVLAWNERLPEVRNPFIRLHHIEAFFLRIAPIDHSVSPVHRSRLFAPFAGFRCRISLWSDNIRETRQFRLRAQ